MMFSRFAYILFLHIVASFNVLIPGESIYYNYFVIVVASYNNAKYYQQNLQSILSQRYPQSRFRVIYTDDYSTDDTANLVKKYVSKKSLGIRFDLIANDTHKGCLENHYNMLSLCEAHEIAVLVDGDDFLMKSDVLEKLNIIYQDPNIHLTYGQYLIHRGKNKIIGVCKPIPADVIVNNTYRLHFNNNYFYTSHLKTFRIELFNKISRTSLQKDGVFFSVCGDVALMCALLEKSEGKIMYVNDVCYGYNADNPINDIKVNNKNKNEILSYIYSFSIKQENCG